MEQSAENIKSNVSTESQELYDIFVAQGIKLASAASKKLSGRASVDALGNTLFEIVSKIEKEGASHGIVFDMPVLLHGSNEILGHLIEMTGTQVTEEQIKQIIGTAVGRYIQDALKTGKMTPDQLQQLAMQGQQTVGNQQEGVLNGKPTR